MFRKCGLTGLIAVLGICAFTACTGDIDYFEEKATDLGCTASKGHSVDANDEIGKFAHLDDPRLINSSSSAVCNNTCKITYLDYENNEKAKDAFNTIKGELVAYYSQSETRQPVSWVYDTYRDHFEMAYRGADGNEYFYYVTRDYNDIYYYFGLYENCFHSVVKLADEMGIEEKQF